MVNKIYNENCLDTMARMGDNEVDYVFTSPPYNRKRNDKYKHYDDIIHDYYSFLKNIIDESIRVSKNHVFLNIQKNYYNASEVYRIFGHYHNLIKECFIWEKSNPMPASGKNITNSFEYILCFGKETVKSNTTYTKNHITTSATRMLKEHKAMMHPEVASFFIRNFTQKNDIIYDPFMGSGTTAIISILNNRQYIGSEISEEYTILSRQRISEAIENITQQRLSDIKTSDSRKRWPKLAAEWRKSI